MRFLIVLLLLAFSPGVGRAQASGATANGGDAVDQFTQAHAALVALFDQAGRTRGPLPRLSDPTAGPLLTAAFNEAAIREASARSVGDLGKVCLLGLDVYERFINTNALGPDGNLDLDLAERNLTVYEDEASRGTVFIVICSATLVAKGAAILQTAGPLTERQKAGVESMTHGAIGTLEGALNFESAPGVKLANRILILDAAVRSSKDVAPSLSPAQRATVLAAVENLMTSSPPEVRARLAQMKAAFSMTECTALCVR